jgi:tRNA(Ile2) C34 agmatinyltransferase TiaS
MSVSLNLVTWLESTEWQERWESLKSASSLAQMVGIALQMGLMLARWLLEDELARRAEERRKWPLCPTCGKRMTSKGWQGRQMQTLVGVIH